MFCVLGSVDCGAAIVKSKRPGYAWQKRKRSAVYLFGYVLFVQHPLERGRWVKTHRSVIEAPCPVCGVKVGDLCIFQGYGNSATHGARRKLATQRRGRAKRSVFAFPITVVEGRKL